MNESSVVFKGVRGGLKIYIEAGYGLTRIRADLEQKLKSSKHFFEGTPVNLIFTGQTLAPSEQQDLMDFISREIEVGSITYETAKGHIVSNDDFQFFDGIEEGMSRFVRGTIRSGQRIFYEGNVAIIGDVNPGGEIIAGGNILIMGTMRGMAHAGATGNHKAVVVAFSLQPTQVRIAEIIARPPEGEIIKPEYPEIAYIKDGNLVIEPYLPGKGK